MKKIQLLLSAVLFSAISYAQQEVDITYGTGGYTYPEGWESVGSLELKGGGHLALGFTVARDVFIVVLDGNGKAARQAKMQLPYLPVCDSVFETGGRYYWTYSIWDKPNKKEKIYLQELDVEKPGFKGDATVIIETTEIAPGIAVARDKRNYYMNPAKNRMLVTYRLQPVSRDDSKNKDVLGFQVFDQDMKKVWGKEITMSLTEKEMNNGKCLIDDKGTIYFIYRVNEEQSLYHFELMVISDEGTKVSTLKIPSGEKYTNDIMLSLNPDGSIFCAGMYASFPKGGDRVTDYNKVSKMQVKSDGFYVFKISPEGKLSPHGKGYFDYPPELLGMYEDKKRLTRIEKNKEAGLNEMENMFFRGIYTAADGDIVLLAEEVYRHMQPMNAKAMDQDRFKSISVLKAKPDGTISWAVKIPKFQQSDGWNEFIIPGGSTSFYSFQKNDELNLFYIDNIKNHTLPVEEEPVVSFDGYFTHAVISNEGKLSRKALFDTRKAGFISPENLTPTPTGYYSTVFHNEKMRMIYLNYK